jgi:hypothetical protein
MNKLRFDLELPRPVGFLDVNDGQHRYAINLLSPDFAKCDLLTDQEKADCAEALVAALVGKQIDEPNTAPLFSDPTWASIRGERDALLKSTDWWAVSDRNMSASEAAYRQALRDVPQVFASPADVVWPTKPA